MASSDPWESLHVRCSVKHCVGLQMLRSLILQCQINLYETTLKNNVGALARMGQDLRTLDAVPSWLRHQLSG